MQENRGRPLGAVVRIAGGALFVSLVAGLPAKAQFWGDGVIGADGAGSRSSASSDLSTPSALPSARRILRSRGSGKNPRTRLPLRAQDYNTVSWPRGSGFFCVGDGMADWLAFGLEDVFAENPEFAILRRRVPPQGSSAMIPAATWNGIR